MDDWPSEDKSAQSWKVKLPTSCITLVDEHAGIRVTDGENDFEQNGVLELRLIRNPHLTQRFDKGRFSTQIVLFSNILESSCILIRIQIFERLHEDTVCIIRYYTDCIFMKSLENLWFIPVKIWLSNGLTQTTTIHSFPTNRGFSRQLHKDTNLLF